MAFCPNCGTPNTDQAEKCVSCSFELKPKSQAKFKGTIMMSGTAAPVAGTPKAAPAPTPAQAPAAAPTPQAAAPAATGGKNLGFEKTMLGGMAVVVPPGGAPAPAPAKAAPLNQTDIGRAATLEQPAPSFQSPPVQTPPLQPPMQPPQQAPAAVAPAPSVPPGPATSSSPSFTSSSHGSTGGFGGGGFTTTSDIPMPPKNNTGKILAIVVAGLLVAACVIGGAIFLFAKKSIEGLSQEGPALEWRTRVAQSLTNVRSLCQQNCEGAAVYFHPQKQAELIAQAKNLSARALGKLVDPTQSEARMLDATDDQAIATGLGLDPQQCVRIVSGSAKVVGCSVPEPSGSASLRIVHLEGLASL